MDVFFSLHQQSTLIRQSQYYNEREIERLDYLKIQIIYSLNLRELEYLKEKITKLYNSYQNFPYKKLGGNQYQIHNIKYVIISSCMNFMKLSLFSNNDCDVVTRSS